MMPNFAEVVIERIHTLGAAIEAHAPKPSVSLGIVMQDRTALLGSEDLGCGKAHALECAWDVHAASEATGAIENSSPSKLIRPAPCFISPIYCVASQFSGTCHAYIRFAR